MTENYILLITVYSYSLSADQKWANPNTRPLNIHTIWGITDPFSNTWIYKVKNTCTDEIARYFGLEQTFFGGYQNKMKENVAAPLYMRA